MPEVKPEMTASDRYDIAIIGAGPAGMAAAVIASARGASVILLDDKPRSGGQIYRNVDASPLDKPQVLGPDYLRGAELTAAFAACSARYLPATQVWHLGDNGEILCSRNGATLRLTARQILVATGAMERPFPIPGWQLPGVMSAGSAQVMLKSDGLVHDNPVFAGTGPLLYLIVAQYLRLGVPVAAVVDTTPLANYFSAMRYALGAVREPAMLLKGVGLLNEIRKAGVPVYRGAQGLEVIGNQSASGLRFQSGGQQHEIVAEQVFLHQGVIPNLNFTRALGLEQHWNPGQLCWQPALDQWGQSSVAVISVAGDASGIVGADAAERNGRLSALNMLARLEKISLAERDQQASADLQALASLNAFRPFVDQLYRPLDSHRIPDNPDTVVCRCEEKTLGQLRAGFEMGAREPNQLKSLTRCGMGPCQGRMCGHTVSELLAKWRDEPVENVGYYRLRSPMRLLRLAEMSNFTELSARDALVDTLATEVKP